VLSLLAHHDPTAEVRGLDAVAPQDRPPINVTRYAFQTMAGIGTLLAAVSAVFLVTWWRRRRLPRSPWFYRAVMLAGPLAVTALIAGWVATEVGRQPWIVYETMRTRDAVTASDGLEVGFAVLVAVYLLLAVAVAWLLRRLSAQSPEREVVHR
jgi:cytochrome d ubiquinol oxidase subunit I